MYISTNIINIKFLIKHNFEYKIKLENTNLKKKIT